MTAEAGFPPISTCSAQVLVLGSMPGRRSLDEQQYYGHPQNSFWRIMSEITQVEATEDYENRVNGLNRAGIAVWDVIKSCVRPGSLDADIETNSISVNDFDGFYRRHQQIKAVFLNGGKAAQEYKRRVLPGLTEQYARLPTVQLLSTSPANARFSFKQKKTNWFALRACLDESLQK